MPSVAMRAICLLPLAIAVGAGIEVASPIFSSLLLVGGIIATLAARHTVRPQTARLCTWSEVEHGLRRELRRARLRARLYGAPELPGDSAHHSASLGQSHES